LIYDYEEQRKKIVSEFLAAGIKRKELVRYFADVTPPEEIQSWLSVIGIDVEEATLNGSFNISNAESNYCPNGRFEPEEIIKTMVSRYNMAREAGYAGSRACGEMNWALRNIPGSDRFLEYEALINTITEPFPHIGMCQYDARIFDGATLLKILQVHPFIIAQGQIVQNPYYIKTEEFLSKYKKA